jgi:hypothetical protein
MSLLQETIDFFKKSNIEIDSSEKVFFELFQIDFKKNNPKIIRLNWRSFSQYEKDLAIEVIDSNNYIYEESTPLSYLSFNS